jgi:hypothetical protein
MMIPILVIPLKVLLVAFDHLVSLIISYAGRDFLSRKPMTQLLRPYRSQLLLSVGFKQSRNFSARNRYALYLSMMTHLIG